MEHSERVNAQKCLFPTVEKKHTCAQSFRRTILEQHTTAQLCGLEHNT